MAAIVDDTHDNTEKVEATTKETLEALIPAIMEIEGGYYDNVCDFISDANERLDQLGSPYRFESTSKVSGSKRFEGVYVDTITVIEVSDE